MDHLFEQDASDVPGALAATIRARIQSVTRPVKPMMSVGAYALVFVAIFSVMVTMFASLIGLKALRVLAPTTAVEMLSALLVMTLWAGLMVARGMRPAGGRLHSWLSFGFVVVAYEALVSSLFRDFSIDRFVQQGAVCLSVGILCAAFTAVPVWFIVRRGFVVDTARTGAAIGLATGLAGLTMLTLHCPILTVSHAGVWHVAVVVVCMAVGALAGRMFQGQ